MIVPIDKNWLDQIGWNSEGLVPVIAQEAVSHRVLMLAWMNRQALEATVTQKKAIYWSRSRNRLWTKGETSGHIQQVLEIRLDCDADAILLLVEQTDGIACHTGRKSCFYQSLDASGWRAIDPILKNPESLYGK